jgi:hypothetical protein
MRSDQAQWLKAVRASVEHEKKRRLTGSGIYFNEMFNQMQEWAKDLENEKLTAPDWENDPQRFEYLAQKGGLGMYYDEQYRLWSKFAHLLASVLSISHATSSSKLARWRRRSVYWSDITAVDTLILFRRCPNNAIQIMTPTRESPKRNAAAKRLTPVRCS